MTVTYSNFYQHLLKEIPEFTTKYKDHLKDNDRVLPHVLIAEFTRFTINTFRESKTDIAYNELFNRCIKFIEELLQSHEDKLQELAHVSFIENLHQAGNSFYEIKAHLLPKTKAILEKYYP